ncbi:MAG: glycosyltransferase family 9 protein [Bacteroidales bacterium]|jgi:ADP-heptose:LPS heptosyltransferase|nr:glycosyltransferase family 9 protein [Bacteroidales bacterium]
MDDNQPPSLKKVLIIRFSSIGDIVLTTPIIRCLKQNFPENQIHFLTKQGYQEVLANNPYIDKLHLFSGHLKETISKLQAEKFDYIVDLQHNLRSKQILNCLHVPHRTFKKLNFRKWITVNLKLEVMPQMHIVDRYFEAIKDFNIKNDLQGLDFFICENEQFDTDDLPAVFEDGYVAISLGAQHKTKRIPPQKIVEAAHGIFKPLLLLGGKDCIEEGELIVSELGERVFNGCGKFTLHQSAYFIQHSDCVLTGDTGLMHIAAALHKPIISVWGNTIPEFGMYPYMPLEREKFDLIEVTSLACRPCSKLGYKSCPKHHFKCMNNISSQQIINQINRYCHESL